MYPFSLLSALGLACWGCAGPSAPAGPAPAAQAPAATRSTSCALADARPARVPWDRAKDLGSAAGKRWLAVGAGRPESVQLVHLDPAGELATAPLPGWPDEVARERGADGAVTGLRFLQLRPEPRWWSVHLADRERPVVSEPRPLVDLAPGNQLQSYASNGRVALITMFGKDAKGEYAAHTGLHEVRTGRRLSAPVLGHVWASTCAAGHCLALASDNRVDSRRQLLRFDDSGATELASWPPWNCAGWSEARHGATWMLAWMAGDMVTITAIDTTTGARREQVVRSPEVCAPLHWVTTPFGLALRVGDKSQGLWPVAHDARGLRVETLQSVSPALEHQRHWAALGDGVVVIDATSSTSSEHSPEDENGIRWYHNTWRFQATVGYLVFDQRRRAWSLRDQRPLPHSGESGELTSGYRAHLLSRPEHATALILGDGGHDSRSLRLRAPCP